MATDTRPDYETARETLESRMNELGITADIQFVPRSKSKEPKAEWINWLAKFFIKGRPMIESEYRQGIGHIVGFKHDTQSRIKSIAWAETLDLILETGKIRAWEHTGYRWSLKTPSAVDVFACLLSDSDAIDHADYEEWAGNLGYDPDSRSGEAIYRACLKIGLTIRSALGEPAFSELRELAGQL